MATQEAKDALEPFQNAYFTWDNKTAQFMSVHPPNVEPFKQEDLDQRAARIRNWVAGFLVVQFCKPESPDHYQRGEVLWLSGFDVDFSSQKGYERPTIYVRTGAVAQYRLAMPEVLRVPGKLDDIVAKHIRLVRDKWAKHHRAYLQKIIQQAKLRPGIDKVVAFGLGSLAWDARFDDIRGEDGDDYDSKYANALYLLHDTYRNHVVVSELVDMMKAKLGGGRALKVYTHDTGYTPHDHELVARHFGMTAMAAGHLQLGDEKALALVDDNTFVYSTAHGYGHPSILAGYCRPAALICPFIDTRGPQASYTNQATRPVQNKPVLFQQTFGPVQFRKHECQNLVEPRTYSLRNMLKEYSMTSLLQPTAVYSKTAGRVLDGAEAYRKFLDDATLFPFIKHKRAEAQDAGRQADADLLGARLADLNCLGKGCAGPWPLALYVRTC